VASLAVIVLLLSLNLATVKMFGEMEFWFAMIKIVAIVGLIVVGLVMVLTHFQSPTGVQASFTHLWNDGGWFPKGISGFFAGFQIAVFAFVGLSWWERPLRKPKIRRSLSRAPLTPFRCVSSCSTSSR
jgi:D-serine/D-alanine/glycine transporter